MQYRRLQEAKVHNQRVLVRTSFDVPAGSRGRVLDTFRLATAVPTIRWLLRRDAAVLLLGHRGRPNGRRRPGLSLRPLVPFLERTLHRTVVFVPSPSRLRLKSFGQPGTVTLLENLRFFPGEEARLQPFARSLAAFGDLFVNDDFSTVHRAHASTVLLPALLPAYAGLRLHEECTQLARLLQASHRPFVVVIGGAKVGDKLSVVNRLLPRVDQLCIGGAASNTCLAALGMTVGRSLIDAAVSRAKLRALLANPKVLLPTDAVVVGRAGVRRVAVVDALKKEDRILDIGPATARRFAKAVSGARALFWAGPLGAAEQRSFAKGTAAVADAVRARTYSVAGGGDTVETLHRLHRAHRFSFLSTGGGAMLAYLAGERLPALEALHS